MNTNIVIIEHGTPAYQNTIQLRDNILRQPLGLSFTAAQLAAEQDQIHMAMYSSTTNKELLACLVLVPQPNHTIKMRQVAVAQKYQRKGLGLTLVQFAENWSRQQGYQLMYCHARDVAVPFYIKQGYQTTGKPFVEVNIKHWRMEKVLI